MFWLGLIIGGVGMAGVGALTVVLLAGKALDDGWPF